MSINENGTEPGGTGTGAGNNLTLTPEEIAAITAARQQFATQQTTIAAVAAPPLLDPTTYSKWNSQWPAPTGKIGKALSASIGNAAAQKDMAKAAFDLFTDPNPNLNRLNGNDDPFAAIINVPEAPLFRVVYGFGSPISMLNPTAPADLFSLIGELEDAAVAPSAMRIPLASLQTKQLLLPSDDMIRAKATNWPNTWPTWKVSDVTVAKGGVEKEVLMVAPIPFFTVVDGLDSDIHAIDMLERLSLLTDAQTEEP